MSAADIIHKIVDHSTEGLGVSHSDLDELVASVLSEDILAAALLSFDTSRSAGGPDRDLPAGDGGDGSHPVPSSSSFASSYGRSTEAGAAAADAPSGAAANTATP